ncbi:hypothetical protein ACIBEA_44175 [Streptomyces sp. NPDC051555]|uniref:hypothetical protein n=1 Tax=Streptomyces sp. NPDC051555 TaxID=3365657 RepID=UPI0037B9283F
MELKIGHTDSSAATAWVGRLATGKTLPHDASVRVCVNVLNRVVSEIESRESERKKRRFSLRPWHASAMYYLIVDDARLLAAHPENAELRDLVAAIRRRGPSVDVVMRPLR